MITIEYTDERCVYAGKSRPGIPLLANEHGFIKPACDYLRYRVIQEGIKTTSAKTYAEDLQTFFVFLARNQKKWQTVTDKTLLTWRDWQTVEDQTKNRRLDTVVSMYIWLEENGYISGVVKIPGFNSDQEFTPQLTLISVSHTNPRSKRTSTSLKSPLLIKNAHSSRIPHTPTDDELSRICSEITNVDPGVTMRNNLLISWYRSAGVRRMEWSNLTIDQIPLWDEIYALYDSSECYEMLLQKTKNDTPRYVAILPELLEETREYIEGPRADLIERFGKQDDYKKPQTLFLSNKTGLALELRSISNAINSLMKKANVNTWGHRIRATFLTELVESEIKAAEMAITSESGVVKGHIDWDLILLKVAERAGHKAPETLQSYVTLVRKRRDKRRGINSSVTLTQREKYANIRLTTARNKLKRILELEQIAVALEQGRKSDAIAATEQLLEKIKSGEMAILTHDLEKMDDLTMKQEEELDEVFGNLRM